MANARSKVVTVTQLKGQTKEQALAGVALSSAMNAALVVDKYQANILGCDLQMDALKESLEVRMSQTKDGDLACLESMLVGQAEALQAIFVSLAMRAQHQSSQKHVESLLSVALKAQTQSRATIQAIVDLKSPRQSTYVGQANISNGPQQVNNRLVTPNSPENWIASNELLVGGENGC
jgi:hypothetical protein